MRPDRPRPGAQGSSRYGARRTAQPACFILFLHTLEIIWVAIFSLVSLAGTLPPEFLEDRRRGAAPDIRAQALRREVGG